MEEKTPISSSNIILYGPPGTGKTYNTVNYAVSIIEGRTLEDVRKSGYDVALKKYNEYTALGRIGFVTFHQSLGYEDFIEGIKPVVEEDGASSGSIKYLPSAGLFYDFCRKAESPRSISGIGPKGCESISRYPMIWMVNLGGFRENDLRKSCLDGGYIRIGWPEYGPLIDDTTDFDLHGGKEPLKDFTEKMQLGDIILSSFDVDLIDAVGVVKGDCEWDDSFDDGFNRKRAVEWIRIFDEPVDIHSLKATRKEQMSAVAHLKNITVNEIMSFVETPDPKGIRDTGNCVFIIDEINRGNISRIFGELITLLEPTRRKGLPECLDVFLPHMKENFSIPSNVFVLGTMNTADKSLASLDTALRRRFEFIEMMPDPSVVNRRFGDVDLSLLLRTINKRIELLYDREHTVGHAYFIGIRSMGDLAECFKKKIIPLLQEYFFDDYEKMCWVLGKSSNPRECVFIRKAKRTDFQNVFDLPDVYEILDDDVIFMDPESYIGIYNSRKI
ncbi:MAG: AAA family ATPase [Candidatus Methanomethylophilaceae archaeon]